MEFLGIMMFVLIVLAVIGVAGLLCWGTMYGFSEYGPLSPMAWLCIIGLVLLVSGLIYEYDREEAKPFDGYVYRKQFVPAHTNVVSTGKTTTVIYVPDTWNMVLKSRDNTDERSCNISQQAFTSYELGSVQHCGGY